MWHATSLGRARAFVALAVLALGASCGSDEGDPARGALAPSSDAPPSGGGGGTEPGGPGGPGGPPPFVPEADAFEPAPAPPALPQAAVDAAATAIRAALARANFTRSVRIENGATGQVVFTQTPNALLKPASNTKLFTTGAAIEVLGEEHGMALVAFGTAAVANGTLTGDLVVLSEHAFFASPQFYANPREAFDRLARALRARGLQRVTGAVRLSGEILYNATSSVGSLNVAASRTAAAAPLGAALTAAGITHGGVTTAATLTPPAGATKLVEYAPMPITVGASPINVLSHNEFADLLSRHLGWEKGADSSYAGGEKVMLDWLTSLNVPTAGVELNDGSGLSGTNRVSADVTVALFRAMNGVPAGHPWKGSMAIAGVRGTVGARLTGDDTRGRFFGKTGTLNDTIALSGYLANRHDGQEYLVSVLQNAVTNQATARAIADDVVRVVARNHRQSGARLPAPKLARVRGGAAKGFLELGWDAVEGAAGYLVWTSDTGRVWRREDARLVKKTTFVAGNVQDAPVVYVRVTALGADGLESEPSPVFAASPAAERAEVLLVDANERWLAEPAPENVLGRHHDFLVALASASPGRRVDSVRHDEVAAGRVDLASYRAVVWAAGESSTAQRPLAEPEQAALRAYVAAGGAALFSGSELLWSLSAPRGSAADVAFANDVLHAGLVNDDAATFELEPAAGAGFDAVPITSFFTPDAMRVETPDVLAPANGGVELLRYVGGAGGAAAVGFPGGGPGGAGRVVVTGFPVESLAHPTARAAVLRATYAYLGLAALP